jgi:hypothetical protein
LFFLVLAVEWSLEPMFLMPLQLASPANIRQL